MKLKIIALILLIISPFLWINVSYAATIQLKYPHASYPVDVNIYPEDSWEEFHKRALLALQVKLPWLKFTQDNMVLIMGNQTLGPNNFNFNKIVDMFRIFVLIRIKGRKS